MECIHPADPTNPDTETMVRYMLLIGEGEGGWGEVEEGGEGGGGGGGSLHLHTSNVSQAIFSVRLVLGVAITKKKS